MKKVFLFLTMVFLMVTLIGCNEDTAEPNNPDQEDKSYTADEAISAGHVVIVQKNEEYNRVHNLEKIFSFEAKINKGVKAASLKVTTIDTSKESRTAKLEYHDEFISYITQNNTNECEMITTFNGSLSPNTPATVNLHHCTKDGGPAPGLRIISDNPDHYFEVKEKFEQQ